MKYYYDNLADALQAMKHGVEIELYSSNDITEDAFNANDLDLSIFDMLGDIISASYKYFVKKESEHLLVPQNDDFSDIFVFVRDEKKFGKIVSFWKNTSPMDSSDVNYIPEDELKTAFRNGLYFPQPKETKE